MIQYGNILLTGVQSLLALAAGWAAGRWRALDPEPCVQQLNLFVLRVCIPALQVGGWWLKVTALTRPRPGRRRAAGTRRPHAAGRRTRRGQWGCGRPVGA